MRNVNPRALLVLAVAATLALPLLGAAPARPAAPATQPRPVVQIAILLDTSGSMQGLIEQAKTHLWKIVNQFATARGPGGQRPEIQVALYHYGTPSLGSENNYIKQLVPLTDDLDKISQELFKLTTDGGDEYCGAVIDKAATELQWSGDKSAYKAIFIAGNEPFTQGGVTYSDACKKAISRGIIVNTIFCGNEQEGVRTGWKDGATLADGAFLAINQNAAIVHIAAPQDKEIAELGQKINATYVAYGARGLEGAQNQMAQDSNVARSAAAAPSAAPVERALTKSSAAYNNAGWDLVDATRQNKVALDQLKAEELPEELRKLDAKGRAEYLEKKAAERAQIQARIQELSAQRDKFLAEKRKEAPESTLDAAVISTVRAQATRNGMTFPEKP